MKRVSLDVVTNASGAGTGTTDSVNGLLRRIEYVKDGTTPYTDGVDVTITDHVGETLLAVLNVNASANWHPRQATHDTAGVASLYAAAGEPVESDIPIDGKITVTIAQGGDTKTGRWNIWVG